jgi:hypothetical protein
MKVAWILLLAIVLCGPAAAATRRDLNDCQRFGDPDRGIAACTSVLDGSRISVSDHAGLLANRAIFYTVEGEFDRALADCNGSLRLVRTMPFRTTVVVPFCGTWASSTRS